MRAQVRKSGPRVATRGVLVRNACLALTGHVLFPRECVLFEKSYAGHHEWVRELRCAGNDVTKRGAATGGVRQQRRARRERPGDKRPVEQRRRRLCNGWVVPQR